MPRDGKIKFSLSLTHDGAHKSYLDSKSRKETDWNYICSIKRNRLVIAYIRFWQHAKTYER